MYGWDKPDRLPSHVPFYLLMGCSQQHDDQLSAPRPEPLTIMDVDDIDEHASDPGIGAADSGSVMDLHSDLVIDLHGQD